MSDFVLIHGTTQGPVGWQRLMRPLKRLGHRSTTVDLAGDNERSAEDYADAVEAQVPDGLTTPIVVAHSGSGQVLPAAARRLGAQRQVWLAAYVPDGRRSLRDDVSPAPGEVLTMNGSARTRPATSYWRRISSSTTAILQPCSGRSPRCGCSIRAASSGSRSRWPRRSPLRTL